MVTDSLVRDKFISETLRQGLKKIYTTQEQVVRANYQLRTGRLVSTLSAHNL